MPAQLLNQAMDEELSRLAAHYRIDREQLLANLVARGVAELVLLTDFKRPGVPGDLHTLLREGDERLARAVDSAAVRIEQAGELIDRGGQILTNLQTLLAAQRADGPAPR
jgi:hypothetical protein